MANGKISTKQQEILEYIKDEILKRGYPPTVREICETVHLKSTSSVHSHLETLDQQHLRSKSQAQLIKIRRAFLCYSRAFHKVLSLCILSGICSQFHACVQP